MVEPTNLKPCWSRSLLIASDSWVLAGTPRVIQTRSDRFASDKLPDIPVKRTPFLLNFEELSRIDKGGFNFQTIANDTRVI
jgi:hypothetical protein